MKQAVEKAKMCSTNHCIEKMFCTFFLMVRTISHACGSHVQEAEKVLLLLCPPMRYFDATAHELQEKTSKENK